MKSDGGILRSVFAIGLDGRILFAQEGAPSWQDVLAADDATQRDASFLSLP
jgi:hypothetical protein